ncbi:Ff.00g093980.m01.CDS01 [Fusarium sp. VM40]|nr:Ff.00g093980.m01.CDS01 [Fusarium sp. VM40]
MGSATTLPFWNYNIPEDQRTDKCPEFLHNTNEKDQGILSTLDEEYHISTWDEVREIIETNHLEKFKRVPSELRRYKAFVFHLKQNYGSVANFILAHRLGWAAPVKPRGVPFEFEDDYKILWNDAPYGIDPRIVHLVVWTKFVLEEDSATGDLTDEARKEIDDFVTRTFRAHVPEQHVLWFRNWQGLQSVKAVQHLHVMLLNPDPDFVRTVTNGDIPRAGVEVSK